MKRLKKDYPRKTLSETNKEKFMGCINDSCQLYGKCSLTAAECGLYKEPANQAAEDKMTDNKKEQ